MVYQLKTTNSLVLLGSFVFYAFATVIRLDYNWESQHNVIRHALKDLNTTFGKTASTLLSRAIVTKGGIWSSIDDFTQSIFKQPSVLDWYIADVGTDGDPRSITLQGTFSCIDRGKSSSEPISWYVATSLSKDLKTEEGPDGFKRTIVGQASSDDITEQCLKGRHENPSDFAGRRITVHLDKHRGTGVRFIDLPVRNETSIVGDETVFDRLWKLRASKDPPTVIVWDAQSGLGVVDGLPFDSGFKVWPTEDLTTERTIDYRVHMIPLAAISAHIGFRLEETQVAREQSRTSNLLLLLTVWSSGLAVLLAVWIVGKTYSDILVERNRLMREEDVHRAVRGMSGWTVGEKATLFIHVAAASILAAPVAQAVVEGNIDPRAAYEVTSGTSVLYSDSREGLTVDKNNPIAGAVFTCTAWINVRPLDDGFVTALTFSTVIILMFACIIAMRVTKRSSETMSRSRLRWPGLSPWNLLGWIILKLGSVRGQNVRNFKVQVRLRREAFSLSGRNAIEERVKEIGLMGSETWRKRASTYYYRRATRNQDEATRAASRNAMHDFLRSQYGTGCVALFARVMMDDELRFHATTALTTPYGAAQPREWEYVRRGAKCESIEFYRTNGRFPDDEALLLTRLGLLKYAKYIAEVRYCDDTGVFHNDGDGVKCMIVVPKSREVASDIDKSFVDNKDGFPNIRRVDDSMMLSTSFESEVQHETADIEWPGGCGGQHYTHYDSGYENIRIYPADRDDFLDRICARNNA